MTIARQNEINNSRCKECEVFLDGIESEDYPGYCATCAWQTFGDVVPELLGPPKEVRRLWFGKVLGGK